MKILIALLFLPLSAWTFTPMKISVKVTSQVCGQPNTLRVAQGMAFKNANRRFVVTNAAAVLNGAGTCHTAGFGTSEASLKLLAWRWGGLALLELTREIPESNVLEFPNSGTSISNFGQLATRDEVTGAWRTIDADLLTFTSDRGTWESMIEAQVTIDGSFAGTPVVMGNMLLGLVSDQFLEQKPGSSAELRFWYKTKTRVTTAPLVIPAIEIERFVRSALAGTLFDDGLFVSLEDQIAGRDQVLTGPYLVSEDCPDPTSSGTSGQYPIGGVDPVGVGGGLSKPGCFIRLKKAPTPAAKLTPLFYYKNWNKRLEEVFRTAAEVDVPYVFSRNSVFDYNDRRVLYSLREFLAQLNRSGMQPLTLAYLPGAAVAGVDPALAEIRVLAQKSAATILDFYHRYGASTSDIENGTVRELYFVTSMAMTEELRDISITQMDALLDKSVHRNVWGMVESEFFFKNKELHPQLLKLRDSLKAL